MQVLLYSKQCVRLQLMNGCLCLVEDILFADEETPQKQPTRASP